jgi:predicted TIM-barrel fold metal-dependent hydrolase
MGGKSYMSMIIVDACAQMGSGDKAGDLLESGISVEKILGNMEFAGVSKSVIYPVTWTDYAKGNKEIYDRACKFTEKFIPFARINPLIPGSLELLEKCLDEYKFKGLRLRPFHDGYQLKDQEVFKAIDIARKYKVPVEIDGEKSVDMLAKIVDEYSEIPIILTHLGSFDNWVWQNTLIYTEMLEKKSNFYMCSCFELMHFFLEDALHKVPDKILFGSDSPTLPPAMELKRIEMMKLSEEQYAKVTSQNILKILTQNL